MNNNQILQRCLETINQVRTGQKSLILLDTVIQQLNDAIRFNQINSIAFFHEPEYSHNDEYNQLKGEDL